MIKAKCIMNANEIFDNPELFYVANPIIIVEFSDSKDDTYQAQISLEKDEKEFFLVFSSGETRNEYRCEPMESLDDLYDHMWKEVRFDGKLEMSWSGTICRRDDATLIAMKRCMEKSIKNSNFVFKFNGYDGKEHDFTGDEQLIKILNDIVRDVYVPEFARELASNGFEKKRK